jgi:hypothetical protein
MTLMQYTSSRVRLELPIEKLKSNSGDLTLELVQPKEEDTRLSILRKTCHVNS